MRRRSPSPLLVLGLLYPLLVLLAARRFDAPLDGLGTLALALPAAVSLGLGAGFALSLRPGRVSLVGRFARAQRGMTWLPSTAEAYCRRVTGVWCAFFLGNALVAGGLALSGSLGWWAAYTGGIAYLLAATLMGVELVYRRRRVEPRVRRELAEAGLEPMAAGQGPP